MHALHLRKIILLLTLIFCTPVSYGDWLLDPDTSTLEFVTIKKETISEVNQFRELTGMVTSAGHAELGVNLASVDTRNPVRDQRIEIHLFDIEKFSTATFTADLDLKAITALQPGETVESAFSGQLSLHGFSKRLDADATITRTSANSFQVINNIPVSVHAADFGMIAGIEKLRELANLSIITPSVEVSFNLVFRQGGTPAAE
jgi:polyisoprenoid-binding protein YceI